ncbi:MAG: hypothetical protein DMG41_08165 [Acidobacteria bacterium]|nr:MAG: hypothetical protein AUH13_07505 [Acidobacteria bacterium 13_2_20CM_58_27]PYT69536.1 MAG: hypothetical protein DMG42_21535 [Acidobacteriota bacterium]PYT89831.1 MAG: hypothetical protein DMG41_08165 [Acidobacteriota bacterium]
MHRALALLENVTSPISHIQEFDKNGRTYPRRCAHGGGSVRTSHVVHVRVRRKGGRSYSRFDSTVRLLAKPFRRTALRRALHELMNKN